MSEDKATSWHSWVDYSNDDPNLDSTNEAGNSKADDSNEADDNNEPQRRQDETDDKELHFIVTPLFLGVTGPPKGADANKVTDGINTLYA
ncbi:hypothetical protein VE02_01341 [Pseudogymnoascus sp. 03VT05]|nr:hypothetical protein VE02_01341 [Pseudogymnoascus sp. 03VT05]